MSCRSNYDPCLDGKLNQIGSYAAAARSSAQNSAASASQSATSATNAATSATNSQNSATDSADSASEANNYLTQVTNIFEDFDERYLGAKSVAPTVDNQGNPLQEGALYWNSVSDQMFAWNGTIWVATNFNQLTPFTATGTTTARNLVTRFSEMPSIFDFGAVGNGVADDLPAFTAANNSGKLIFIPKPPVAYNVSAPIKMDKCAVLIDPNNTNWAALTDNGNINFLRGKQNGITSPAAQDCNFWRLPDRILVGEMANKWTGSSTNTGNAWFADTVNYPGYLGVNAKISVSTSDYSNQSINGDNPYGICAGVRTSDSLASGIALGACIVNDRNVAGSGSTGWGLMIEAQHQNQFYGTNGIEIAIRNSANTGVYLDPYTISSPSATLGIQLSGGGDAPFGSATTGPSSIGICVTAFGGLNKWYTGIQFRKGALWGDSVGEVLPDGDTGSEAIQLSYNHAIRWWENSSGTPTVAGSIICTNNTPNTKTKIQIDSSIVSFTNNQGSPFFTAVTTPTSASRIQINSGSATQIILSSVGIAGTDVDLALSPQNGAGSGRVKFGTYVNTPSSVTGYIEIKDGSGNIRKLAVMS